jgi:phosphopantothenoylcysteine decarboxylase/phosphopantothenate--cysteine ligase
MAPQSQRIVLGVGGGIAAYKAADLVRRLRDAGAEVRVVLTDGARHFVTATTFQALSGNPVRSELWDDAAEAAMGHIELARWAHRVLIAPATANLIARLAGGHADDLLTTLCLATSAPLVLVPAMNRQMWAHPATQDNLARLRARGAQVLGPASGGQACGETGPGRMLEPHEIVDALRASDVPPVLGGRRVLVTAGPTYEDIDPVRYVGNRSSGRMGFAIAAAARAAGAGVTLVCGPVRLDTPAGVDRIDVRSARQMLDAVQSHIAGQDLFIGAAAVADYTVAAPLQAKRKKDGAPWQLALVPTVDIVSTVAALAPRPYVVGFAAETEDVEANARAKRARKGMDLIVANQVGQPGSGFDADDNALVVYGENTAIDLGHGRKQDLATRLIEIVAKAMASR